MSVSHENWLGTGCLAPDIISPDCNQLSLASAASREFKIPLIPVENQSRLWEAYQMMKQDSPADKRIWPHDTSGFLSLFGDCYMELLPPIRQLWAVTSL
ncbi:hypothetical protein FRX31_033520 [Thalictrum thalictroides]|uniref:Uncharacterized protein n=1 Tax=Thalictrum thalictroides TaxID=46969 RepID=A0A7J6UXI1_THATH|nr:hypothetical protein FRX31_033520 [Thalictrum thalictroides]